MPHAPAICSYMKNASPIHLTAQQQHKPGFTAPVEPKDLGISCEPRAKLIKFVLRGGHLVNFKCWLAHFTAGKGWQGSWGMGNTGGYPKVKCSAKGSQHMWV